MKRAAVSAFTAGDLFAVSPPRCTGRLARIMENRATTGGALMLPLARSLPKNAPTIWRTFKFPARLRTAQKKDVQRILPLCAAVYNAANDQQKTARRLFAIVAARNEAWMESGGAEGVANQQRAQEIIDALQNRTLADIITEEGSMRHLATPIGREGADERARIYAAAKAARDAREENLRWLSENGGWHWDDGIDCPSEKDQKGQIPALRKAHPEVKQTRERFLCYAIARNHRAWKLKKATGGGAPKFAPSMKYRTLEADLKAYPGFAGRFGECCVAEKSSINPKYARAKYGALGIKGMRGKLVFKQDRPIDGRIKDIKLTCQDGQWFVCIAAEVEAHAAQTGKKMSGVDLGLKKLAFSSNDETWAHPLIGKQMREITAPLERKFSRKMRAHKEAEAKEGRRLRYSRRMKRVHSKIRRLRKRERNLRKQNHHNVAREIVGDNRLVAMEDLDIKQMISKERERGNKTKERALRRNIADAGWYQLREIVRLRCENLGVEFRAVNPEGTTRTCAACGNCYSKREWEAMGGMKVRVYKCANCGHEDDRDHNAAVNILQRALGDRLKVAAGNSRRGSSPGCKPWRARGSVETSTSGESAIEISKPETIRESAPPS